MKQTLIGVTSAIVILACVSIGNAQGTGIVSAEQRERQRLRQLAIEDPANNPFKIEPYDPVKAPQPEPEPLRATVELQVVDVENGDTIIISNTANQNLRVRLQGIDAPESGQVFFSESKNNLSKLVSSKSVSIEFDPHGKPDKEGRVIAKVYVEGIDVAFEQVTAGFAWFCKDYKKLQSESDRYTYAAAEKDARAKAIGLWRDPAPLAPWDHRKQ